MDLRNNQITLGELWDNPKSRSVFQKRIPMLAKHPLQGVWNPPSSPSAGGRTAAAAPVSSAPGR